MYLGFKRWMEATHPFPSCSSQLGTAHRPLWDHFRQCIPEVNPDAMRHTNHPLSRQLSPLLRLHSAVQRRGDRDPQVDRGCHSCILSSPTPTTTYNILQHLSIHDMTVQPSSRDHLMGNATCLIQILFSIHYHIIMYRYLGYAHFSSHPLNSIAFLIYKLYYFL